MQPLQLSREETKESVPSKTTESISGPKLILESGKTNHKSESSWKSELARSVSIVRMLGQRDLAGRYRGSLLGKLWPLVHPLGQLLIYSFVFSIVLKIKFGDSASPGNFAFYFMTGLIPWSIFAESVARASTVILENPNFVTKVVFPLETLPLVNLYSAAGTQLLAFAILLAAIAIFGGGLHATALLIVLPLSCLLLFSAGASWLLASLGVFVRDTRHIVSLALQAGMYATPILYPASSVPGEYRWVLVINPLSGIVEDCRRVLLEGRLPDWNSMMGYASISVCIAIFGYFFFAKTKKAFADVM